jgi:hypothetical protein
LILLTTCCIAWAGPSAIVPLGWMRDHGIPFLVGLAICVAMALAAALLIVMIEVRPDVETNG